MCWANRHTSNSCFLRNFALHTLNDVTFPVNHHVVGQAVAVAPSNMTFGNPRRFLFIIKQIDELALLVFSAGINI